jgi:large subunit ribosomal protein L35
MPKMKTNRAAAKRFRKTGTGKIRRSKASGSHLMTHKNRKRRRRLRDNDIVDGANARHVRALVPYK